MTLEERLSRLEERLAHVESERDQYQQLYELTTLELQRLRRNLFGQKAEVVDPRQVQLAFEKLGAKERDPALEALLASKNSAKSRKGKSKSKPAGRKPIPEDLPVERIVLEPPGDTQGLKHIRDELTETIEWRSASLVRVIVVRPCYADPKASEHGVVAAEAPEKPIARCKAGVGLLASVITQKHADHIPLHRQEKIFARHGVSISRSTMSGWLQGCAALLVRITDAMHADALARSSWIGVDATGVLVQAPKRCKRGHFWVMVSSCGHVLFRYSERHSGEDAHALLEGFNGYVQADASSVYHELYRKEDVIEAGCWAHCRRNFFEAILSDEERALQAIGWIKSLYRIERELTESKLDASQRLVERKARAGPVVQGFFDWVKQEKINALPRSPLGKALQYADNQRQALERFLEDGRLRLDNNLSELELRRQVVGRKNWLFCGNDEAAQRNTVFVSLVASCERAGVEPWAYLRDVLSLLPRWNARRVIELAPIHWLETLKREETQALLDADIFRSVSAAQA
ncbi:MAG: IS66 family transposase [Myxococcota bacterium]